MSAGCLFAGPWVGEFGHELFSWQALLRAKAREYATVIVASRKGHNVLYRDYADSYADFESNAEHCNYATNSKVNIGCYNISETFSLPSDCDIILPTHRLQCKPVYVMYGNVGAHEGYDIVLHVRHICGNSKSQRNWPVDRWEQLVSKPMLKTKRMCCVGRSTGAMCLDGLADERDIPLSELADILANSRLIIGPSSGPMHFASLCGCTHVVWTQASHVQDRYLRAWNPFGIKAVVLCKEDVIPDDIVDAVNHVL